MEIAIAILLALVTIAVIGYPFLSYRKIPSPTRNSRHRQTHTGQDFNHASKSDSKKPGIPKKEPVKQNDMDDIEEQIRNLRHKK